MCQLNVNWARTTGLELVVILTGGLTNEYVIRPLDPKSASIAIAVKISVPMGCD